MPTGIAARTAGRKELYKCLAFSVRIHFESGIYAKGIFYWYAYSHNGTCHRSDNSLKKTVHDRRFPFHTSLAGVAFGLIAGINPIVGATLFSITAALGIEKIRRAFPKYAEVSIAVIMSTGIGLAGVLSGYVKADFLVFLFVWKHYCNI